VSGARMQQLNLGYFPARVARTKIDRRIVAVVIRVASEVSNDEPKPINTGARSSIARSRTNGPTMTPLLHLQMVSIHHIDGAYAIDQEDANGFGYRSFKLSERRYQENWSTLTQRRRAAAKSHHPECETTNKDRPALPHGHRLR
jgi:hypothetical protein